MLYEVFRHLKASKWCLFNIERDYEIVDGKLDLDFLVDGQYFMVEGSKFNDGEIFKYPANELTDEKFHGVITAMAIPKAVIPLVEEIEKYNEQAVATPYTSESFGGYSYSKATGQNGSVVGWTTAFRDRLNAWREI